MNTYGEWHSCPRHYLQCNEKKNITYCVPCHNLLFNKLTVLKLPDVVVFAEGYTFLTLICFQGPAVVWQDMKELTKPFFSVTALRWHCGSSGQKNQLRLLFVATRCQCGVTLEMWSSSERSRKSVNRAIYYRCMQSLGRVAVNLGRAVLHLWYCLHDPFSLCYLFSLDK